jgi:hypothetical protein
MPTTRIDIYYPQIQNYELGILFLLKDEEVVDRIACYERPPRKYSANDLPWVSQQYFERAVTDRILVCATLDARGIFCIRCPMSYHSFQIIHYLKELVADSPTLDISDSVLRTVETIGYGMILAPLGKRQMQPKRISF